MCFFFLRTTIFCVRITGKSTSEGQVRKNPLPKRYWSFSETSWELIMILLALSLRRPSPPPLFRASRPICVRCSMQAKTKHDFEIPKGSLSVLLFRGGEAKELRGGGKEEEQRRRGRKKLLLLRLLFYSCPSSSSQAPSRQPRENTPCVSSCALAGLNFPSLSAQESRSSFA